ncbi:hypothetical protein LINPERPRIM_LOCUS22207 [Linum perenne]
MMRVLFETDCQMVKQALDGTLHDAMEFRSIITKGRALLANQPHLKVDFVRRGGNTVAHALA